ncbi:MAG: hypothetical protein Tsb0021_09250 [Chlamydiales bacterium]
MFKHFIYLFLLTSSLVGTEFTVCSYNCGGLSDHYDYIRAVSMHGLMQERYDREPQLMDRMERIQTTALKILFSTNPIEKSAAEQEWAQNNYDTLSEKLLAHPDIPNSINKKWKEKSDATVTNYRVRPIVIHDSNVATLLQDHIKDMVSGQDISYDAKSDLNTLLQITRHVMAQRIFKNELKYDLIALQEADYLDASVFPEEYEVLFSESTHSVNGIAWNRSKFEVEEVIGSIAEGRGFLAVFRENSSGKTIAIASGHLTGCNPFTRVIDEKTEKNDSDKGDNELITILSHLESIEADIKLLAMDSNVTALHPRLSLLKEAGYTVDSTHHLEPTCSNPWQILNTRLDWIALKSPNSSITNIPVTGVGLNSPQTNISDHKPVAACVSF